MPAVARGAASAPAAAGKKNGGADTSPLLVHELPVALVIAAAGIAAVRGRRREGPAEAE